MLAITQELLFHYSEIFVKQFCCFYGDSQRDRWRSEGERQKDPADNCEQLQHFSGQPYLAIVAWKCDWRLTQSAAEGDD